MPFSLAVGPSYIYIKLAAATLGALLWLYSIVKSSQKECRRNGQSPGLFRSFMLFFYSCFVQPHKHGRTNNQQDSLERFYKKQATGYDATREFLLRGREDMLALAAADLKAKDASVAVDESSGKHIWVDVSGHMHYTLLGADLPRSEVALAGISKPCRASLTFLAFFLAYIWSISRRLCVRLPRQGFTGWGLQMSPSSARMLAPFVLKTLRRICRRLPQRAAHAHGANLWSSDPNMPISLPCHTVCP